MYHFILLFMKLLIVSMLKGILGTQNFYANMERFLLSMEIKYKNTKYKTFK